MVRKRSKAFVVIVLAVYGFVGISLVGAILRIVGNYLGLVWGLIAVTIVGGIYLTFLYRLGRHLSENSRHD